MLTFSFAQVASVGSAHELGDPQRVVGIGKLLVSGTSSILLQRFTPPAVRWLIDQGWREEEAAKAIRAVCMYRLPREPRHVACMREMEREIQKTITMWFTGSRFAHL